MGHKFTREQILDDAVAMALAEGLSSLTFGALAKHLGTSDRVIVYYFPSKTTLITDVLLEVGNRLQETLARALVEPADGHRQLVRTAFKILARDEFDPLFAVYFEVCGLAAAGVAPYHDLAAPLTEGWIDWLSKFFTGTAHRRRAEAEASLALIDGMLLLRQLAGPAAADRAAKALGMR
ncbi:MAG: TetR/AcrR family transcriptional regulator [Mycobacterium sp.]|nr:MAG: TetR/AcrR family transcriptional regulator [Mycobacterium sp.]